MDHWSPRQQQEQGLALHLSMSSRPGPSGPLAPPWRPDYGAWSPPISASRCAVSRCSGTTSCFMTASSAWGWEEAEPLTVITLEARWRGSWVKSWGGVLWSPLSPTRCFLSGRGGNDVVINCCFYILKDQYVHSNFIFIADTFESASVAFYCGKHHLTMWKHVAASSLSYQHVFPLLYARLSAYFMNMILETV